MKIQTNKNMKQTFKTIAKAVAYTAAGIAIWAIWILIMLIADAEGVML